MKRILWTFQAVLGGFCLLLFTGCAGEDDAGTPVPPSSADISGLPWNRPMPGEASRRFGGFPQSH